MRYFINSPSRPQVHVLYRSIVIHRTRRELSLFSNSLRPRERCFHWVSRVTCSDTALWLDSLWHVLWYGSLIGQSVSRGARHVTQISLLIDWLASRDSANISTWGQLTDHLQLGNSFCWVSDRLVLRELPLEVTLNRVGLSYRSLTFILETNCCNAGFS